MPRLLPAQPVHLRAPARPSAAATAVTPADLPLLRACQCYLSLTAGQLTRLCYAPGSRSYAQARLKRLVELGCLQRTLLPRPSRSGSAPLVYTLARKGLRALAAAGGPPARRYRPSEARAAGYLHLRHTLALNDVLIALELLCRQQPLLRLAELRHERDLKQRPVLVRLQDGASTAVIPDAWIDLRLAGRYQECYAIELDRGSTGRRAWQRKLAALLSYAAGPYQQAFGTPSLTVAVVATEGPAHAARLLDWTEQALHALQQPAAGALFRFTGQPVTSCSPQVFFQDAHWQTPFVSGSTALLDLSDRAVPSAMTAVSDRSEIAVMHENRERAERWECVPSGEVCEH